MAWCGSSTCSPAVICVAGDQKWYSARPLLQTESQILPTHEETYAMVTKGKKVATNKKGATKKGKVKVGKLKLNKETVKNLTTTERKKVKGGRLNADAPPITPVYGSCAGCTGATCYPNFPTCGAQICRAI